ncbi:MAG: helix-turn-helix domain-containing protein [Candidatus Omnitrophica bacterium]|nr:helix-turn-helix domain-containing protein [Candidatus Omnitrophota bacterium]
MKEKVLTSEEVSSYFRIPKLTVYKLAKDGAIPAAKVGKHWRFKKCELDKWFRKKQASTNK